MNYLNGGYAMIKHNSTQEELQIAYRSKKPVLCYDENRRAHWAVIEETATESVDEETQEPITIYEYSYRLIDEVSGGATLDDIVDSRGNKRFVEGNAVISGISSALEVAYNKWSLSGTHLMLVLCIKNNSSSTKTITGPVDFATYDLPSYILNKVSTVVANLVDQKSFTIWGTSNEAQIRLNKDNDVLHFKTFANIDIGSNQSIRIQFDLLIDTDYSE